MADDVGSSHVRTDFGELSDAELVRATRDGSRRAYAALWKRHSVSALKYAKTLAPADADDVVSEAFLKVYAAIKAGRGPEEDFRFYIRSAVRNTYVSMVRASRTSPAGDAIEDVIGDRGAEVASVRSFDGSATARAFLSLPTRWQEVLWYTEVEGLSRERTATILGLNANAVSALSFRAREALRTAWLQEHISTQSDLDRGCEAVTPMLGAYSRRGLSRRDRLRVEHHVNGCAHCTSVVGELSEMLTPGRLALILLPIALAGGGAAGFASKFGGGSVVAASAIAPPTATVVAAVGGSSAATGAAALSVVGKVAACAIVATMIVPPAQMLIEEVTHHSASIGHSVEHVEPAGVDDFASTHLPHPAGDRPDAATGDADSNAGQTGGGGEVDAGKGPSENAGDNPDANAGGTPNANAGGGNAGGSAEKEKDKQKPDSAGVPSTNANANATANPTEKAPTVPKATAPGKSGEKAATGAPASAGENPNGNSGAKDEKALGGSSSAVTGGDRKPPAPAAAGSTAPASSPAAPTTAAPTTAAPRANGNGGAGPSAQAAPVVPAAEPAVSVAEGTPAGG